MERLLYYPNFEIQDENFLKFALLYIGELRPIIPQCAYDMLGEQIKRIMKNTRWLNPYMPNLLEAEIATCRTISNIENYKRREIYANNAWQNNIKSCNYILYEDKYTGEFEEYCLENELAERCNEGIKVDARLALMYMQEMEECVSVANGIETITDSPSSIFDTQRRFGNTYQRAQQKQKSLC